MAVCFIVDVAAMVTFCNDWEDKDKETDCEVSVPFIIIEFMILFGIIIYPLVGFVALVRQGILSKETYPRDAYCSCA